MLTLEQIREKLEDRNLAKIARAIGVSTPYMHRIKNSTEANPTYKVLLALSNYLESRP